MNNKPIIEIIKSITIFKNGSEFLGSHSRNTIIVTGNTDYSMFPIMYIKKPKAIKEEDWEIIKEKLQISILK